MPIFRLVPSREIDGFATLVLPLEGSQDAHEPFAALLDANLLAPDAPPIPSPIPGGRLIAWSGSLDKEDLFARDPRAWLPAGLDSFRAMCRTILPRLEREGARLLFRPHARHVLCDPQRCRTLALQWQKEGAPFGIVLDAAAMLEENMLREAADHLTRAFEMLGSVAEAVLLANVRPPDSACVGSTDSEEPLGACSLHLGAVDPELIIRASRRHIPESTPRILLDDALDEQLRLLQAEA